VVSAMAGGRALHGKPIDDSGDMLSVGCASSLPKRKSLFPAQSERDQLIASRIWKGYFSGNVLDFGTFLNLFEMIFSIGSEYLYPSPLSVKVANA